MFIKSIDIKGLLSFRDVHLEMRPLNVLVGPNASGKSNLIEIMALLQALPRDLLSFFRSSGGINDWLWKGPTQLSTSAGSVEVLVDSSATTQDLRYVLKVAVLGQNLHITEEKLEEVKPEPFSFFQLNNGAGTVSSRSLFRYIQEDRNQQIKWNALFSGQSIFSQLRDPVVYPEMNRVGVNFGSIHFYREWNMGRASTIRKPQPTDAPTNSLYEDFSNLSLILNRLDREGSLRVINEQLKQFYETFESIGFDIYANTAQLWIREKGLSEVVPATRLSDGTLRFLALLSILCHPEPPPLVCIEEPELGLHPDVIHQVAKLLIEASQRTQLIVTTHSAELIDHLWEDPESVVVCERYPDTGTEFNRLKKEELTSWLERYELGELWRTGQIGGNRF